MERGLRAVLAVPALYGLSHKRSKKHCDLVDRRPGTPSSLTVVDRGGGCVRPCGVIVVVQRALNGWLQQWLTLGRPSERPMHCWHGLQHWRERHGAGSSRMTAPARYIQGSECAASAFSLPANGCETTSVRAHNPAALRSQSSSRRSKWLTLREILGAEAAGIEQRRVPRPQGLAAAATTIRFSSDRVARAAPSTRRATPRQPGGPRQPPPQQPQSFSAAMGYDIDRFVGPVNDGLLCSICRDVLEDALQAPCEHAYCSACIHGWLVHESCCPEDRRALVSTQLRPVCRYMRNDLGALRIRCRNTGAGCDAVCPLERLAAHESACGFDAVPCPSEGCTATAERRRLDEHLLACPFRRRACPRGCGAAMLDAEDEAHSCAAELRTALDLLRSETICKLEDVRHDAELRLDAQRAHIVQRDGNMQAELESLKSQVARLTQSMKMLAETAEERRKDFEKSEREKLEMLEMIKALAKVTCIKCHKSERVTVL